MNKSVLISLKENEKLFSHFMENSYYIKDLNRNPNVFKTFESKMKEVYKERTSDKISKAIDTVDMISSIIDTIK